MKNMESFPPLKTIELANKKLPEIWAAIEKTRADMLSTGHNPWREDIYIPAWQILSIPGHFPSPVRCLEIAVPVNRKSSFWLRKSLLDS